MSLYDMSSWHARTSPEQQVEGLVQEFRTIIEGQAEPSAKTEYWGPQGPHLPHQEESQGAFLLMNIDAPPPPSPSSSVRCASPPTSSAF
jgi:ribosomal protein S6